MLDVIQLVAMVLLLLQTMGAGPMRAAVETDLFDWRFRWENVSLVNMNACVAHAQKCILFFCRFAYKRGVCASLLKVVWA